MSDKLKSVIRIIKNSTVSKRKVAEPWNDFCKLLLLMFLLNLLINTVQGKNEFINNFSDNSGELSASVLPDNSPTLVGQFSAYNADPAQTNSDPLTMASGKAVYDGAVANNCLEFGSQIEIDGKVYTVEDRMNSRYDCSHFDLFFWDYEEALKFGRQELEYMIISEAKTEREKSFMNRLRTKLF